MTNRALAGMISEMSRLVVTLRQAAGEDPKPATIVPCSASALNAASDQIAHWHNQLLDLMDVGQVALGGEAPPSSSSDPG